MLVDVVIGLSPRVRGNPSWPLIFSRSSRSIPARAGEPGEPSGKTNPFRVYPRACGGTVGAPGVVIIEEGLSPRVRGNPAPSAVQTCPSGSIPARAGEPVSIRLANRSLGVYPRACGGTEPGVLPGVAVPGLSPRVRGNLSARADMASCCGSIPARAGEPGEPSGKTNPFRVYPRACGGTVGAPGVVIIEEGLSRACGGTNDGELFISAGEGLSPRVRGNHQAHTLTVALDGSIPARAGEPCFRSSRRSFKRVYPRACGGTEGSRAVIRS